QRTFEEIVRRHEAFRTTFTTIDGHPVQVITPRSTPPVDVIDLRSLPSQEREDRAMQLAEEEARRPFDLTNGPPLRVSLLRLGDREHILLFNMHHIVSDAWSLGLLTGEILKLYRAHAAGEIIQLATLSTQYADFAVWQREWLRGEALEGQLAYWRKQLDGAPVLELPTDYPRPVIQHYRGALISRDMPGDLLDRLKHLSNREGVTLFMTLLSAFEALLYRYTGQEDIAVAVPVANRNWFATEGIVGSFVNTVVMRIELSGDPTFRQLLQRVREVALGAYAHQDMPYAKLVAELQPERDTSHVPLAQVAFNVVNVPISPLRLGDLQAIPLQVDRHGAQFDLNLTVTDTEVLQQVSIEYDTDLFREETIRRLLEHLLVLWRGILTDPEQRISSMPLLTDAELQQLIVRWNDTAAAYPQDACIHHLFEEQARRHGAAVALRFQDQELTYEELDQQAERLAYYLQQRGVGPETLVGLCVERSPAMLVGLLGVLKAGAGYLPLDPTYPRERLAFMLEETRVPILLTLERLAADLPTDHFQVICLDRDWGAIAQEPGGELEHDVTPENVAYVIYTSGS
ncbi:MAG: condensation domain-containing protein, partial [Anaerolineae bacterium]